ncbi:MAG: thiol:disulfide interchange protein [Comamonadaceae bacterium]|nr:thiol:disulfide interchange protein [Comamonadaceae bacterium]
MKLRSFILPFIASVALTLSACSRDEAVDASASPGDSASIARDQAPDALAAEARGFAVGALLGAQPVYVLFDPQCPHCARLWESSQPLLGKVKFIWVPVAIINAKSAPQGAALLTAASPKDAMAKHETLLLSNQGGLVAAAQVPDEVMNSIKRNTLLFNRLGAESVPFIVARNLRTGQVVTHSGAMPTETLAELIGLGQ